MFKVNKMWNILSCISFILLLIQFLHTVHCAPVILGKRHVKGNGHRRRLTKSEGKIENAEKKSNLNKKTTLSINGHFLPLAQLSTSDKNIHVTVQKANPLGQQLQPTIQEVSLGGQNIGNGVVQNPVVQTSGIQPQVGLHPGIQTSNNLGNGGLQNTNTIGMSPGITTNGNQVVGMSPGITNNGNQVLGMSPGITNTGNQVLGMSPGIQGNNVQNNGIPNQGIQTNCGTNNLLQGQNNLNGPGQNINTQGNQGQALLVKNPDGQLSYRPLVC